MSEPFEDLLAILCDTTQPLPKHSLTELSDLDTPHLARFAELWPSFTPERRRELLHELGELANQHVEFSFERINRHALLDPDAEVRRSAIVNLWECEDPALVRPLVLTLTQDPSPEVAAAAAEALAQFVYLGELDRLRPDLRQQAEEALLASFQSDKPLPVRRRCLEALGYSSRTEVPDLLRNTYDIGLDEIKQSALLAMGRSASKEWAPQILAELSSPSPGLRSQSAWAAGELELHQAIPDLVELLEDANQPVRHSAVWALGQLGGATAARSLTQLLNQTSSHEERAWIEEALEHLAFVDGTRDFLLFRLDEPDEDPSP